jgi:hypothetical protein
MPSEKDAAVMAMILWRQLHRRHTFGSQNRIEKTHAVRLKIRLGGLACHILQRRASIRRPQLHSELNRRQRIGCLRGEKAD